MQSGPGVVWIEFGQRLCDIGSILAKILFVDHPILIDDERLDTRISVLRRVRNIGESTGHLSIDGIRLRTAFGCGTLHFQLPEVIAIEGLRRVRLDSKSLFGGECHQRSQRAGRRTLRRLPVQTVLLASIADEFLRVLLHAAMLLSEVLGLGVRQCFAYVDGHDLVAADATGDDLFFPRRRVEVPLARRELLQRNGKRLSAPTSSISLPSGSVRQRFITPYACTNPSIEALSSFASPE